MYFAMVDLPLSDNSAYSPTDRLGSAMALLLNTTLSSLHWAFSTGPPSGKVTFTWTLTPPGFKESVIWEWAAFSLPVLVIVVNLWKDPLE